MGRRAQKIVDAITPPVALASFNLEDVAWAAEQPKTDGAVEDRVRALIPEEAYIAGGMMEFDVPGLAIGGP